MLCGHILGRSFTPAFEQMRLDNTASIACGTFVQIRTQIPRPSMHPYRHMSGQRDAAPRCPAQGHNKQSSIIRQVLPASSPSKPARRSFSLPLTLNSACSGSVTLPAQRRALTCARIASVRQEISSHSRPSHIRRLYSFALLHGRKNPTSYRWRSKSRYAY